MLADSETCRKETKVRSQPWRRQTFVWSLQENLEVVITTPFQNQYELLVQQVWASLADSTSLSPPRIPTPNQLCESNPRHTRSRLPPFRHPNTFRHLYTNLFLVFIIGTVATTRPSGGTTATIRYPWLCLSYSPAKQEAESFSSKHPVRTSKGRKETMTHGWVTNYGCCIGPNLEMWILLWLLHVGNFTGALDMSLPSRVLRDGFGFTDGLLSQLSGRLISTNVCHFFSFVAFNKQTFWVMGM